MSSSRALRLGAPGRAGRWPEGLSGDPKPFPIIQCLSSNVTLEVPLRSCGRREACACARSTHTAPAAPHAPHSKNWRCVLLDVLPCMLMLLPLGLAAAGPGSLLLPGYGALAAATVRTYSRGMRSVSSHQPCDGARKVFGIKGSQGHLCHALGSSTVAFWCELNQSQGPVLFPLPSGPESRILTSSYPSPPASGCSSTGSPEAQALAAGTARCQAQLNARHLPPQSPSPLPPGPAAAHQGPAGAEAADKGLFISPVQPLPALPALIGPIRAAAASEVAEHDDECRQRAAASCREGPPDKAEAVSSPQASPNELGGFFLHGPSIGWVRLPQAPEVQEQRPQ